MKELLFVCIGSFFGGGMRYLSGKGIAFFMNTQLPLATLAVNVVGSFLIGLLSAMALSNNISPATKLLLITGFCGGFTTFSTFANESMQMLQNGSTGGFISYVLASIIGGLILIGLGYWIVK